MLSSLLNVLTGSQHLYFCLQHQIHIFPNISSWFGSVTEPVASILLLLLIIIIIWHTILVNRDYSKNLWDLIYYLFPHKQEVTAHGKRAIKNYILFVRNVTHILYNRMQHMEQNHCFLTI